MYKKRRVFIICIFSFIIIASLYFLTLFILNSFLFKIEKIITEPFNYNLSKYLEEKIIGKNIFKLDIKKLKKQTLKDFYKDLEEIEFLKILPNSIKVRFKPRKFIFQVFYRGKWYMLDKNLKAVKRLKYAPHPQLIEIRGLEFKDKDKIQVLRVLSQGLEEQGFLKEIKFIEIYTLVNLRFKMKSNLKIIIGYKDIKNRLSSLKEILKRIKKEDLEYVDLRFEKPVIRFKR